MTADFGLARSSPFLDLIGPFHQRTEPDGSITVGVRSRADHANHRGSVHGAVLAALADISLGRSVATRADQPIPVVTVSLSVDYLSGASVGEWLEATATVQRVGRRLGFANGLITADGRSIAQTSATFAVVETARVRSDDEHDRSISTEGTDQ